MCAGTRLEPNFWATEKVSQVSQVSQVSNLMFKNKARQSFYFSLDAGFTNSQLTMRRAFKDFASLGLGPLTLAISVHLGKRTNGRVDGRMGGRADEQEAEDISVMNTLKARQPQTGAATNAGMPNFCL